MTKPSSVFKCDDKVKNICKKVKPSCEKKQGKKYSVFEPVFYRTVEVPTGITYYIKAKCGQNDYSHYKVFCAKSNKGKEPEPQLISCEDNQTLSSEIKCD